jgi:hypothetical protein
MIAMRFTRDSCKQEMAPDRLLQFTIRYFLSYILKPIVHCDDKS